MISRRYTRISFLKDGRNVYIYGKPPVGNPHIGSSLIGRISPRGLKFYGGEGKNLSHQAFWKIVEEARKVHQHY